MVHLKFEQLLLTDATLLGEVYRRTQAGESPEQIRVARGASRPNFVWNYLRTIRALLDRDLPNAPTVARGTAATYRSLLNRSELSAGTRKQLEADLRILEGRASDPAAKRAEDQEAVEATSRAEEMATPGIYVYALPHCVRHPYDEESGHTLLKVGRADRSVIRRFREQTRTTALPEDPVLLRVYPCEENDSGSLERKFHSLLEAADHDRSTARTGGTEWFLTSLRFLDEVAMTLGLQVEEVTPWVDVLE